MSNEQTRVEEWPHTLKIMTYGFAALLALIAIAIAAGVLFRLVHPPTVATAPYPFWGFGFLWPIFGLFFLFFVLRWIFWPWRPYPYRYYRRWGGWGYDDAMSILRARYARGELTKEQFDQMTLDLRQQS